MGKLWKRSYFRKIRYKIGELKMTIYLHCEGNSDYAVIPHLIKKVLNITDLEMIWIKRKELEEFRTHRKEEMKYHFKYILALAYYSHINKCKNIAFHIDSDNEYFERYSKIQDDFKKQKKDGKFHCLAVVPKKTIESWLLADENAYPSIPKNPKLPAKPEELWGNVNEENTDHPKKYFYRILNQFNLEKNSDTYANIAENIDIKTLAEKCKVSFGQFIRDAQDFLK